MRAISCVRTLGREVHNLHAAQAISLRRRSIKRRRRKYRRTSSIQSGKNERGGTRFVKKTLGGSKKWSKYDVLFLTRCAPKQFMDLIIFVMEASEEEEGIDIDDYTLVK